MTVRLDVLPNGTDRAYCDRILTWATDALEHQQYNTRVRVTDAVIERW